MKLGGIKNLDMAQIAKSGQIFRFNEKGEDSFELFAGSRKLLITEKGLSRFGEHEYELDCSEKEFEIFWKNYFDLSTDYSYFISKIDEKDGYLKAAAKYAGGIRILRQDPWEMVVSFIISQRKSIPAIKTSIEKLCLRFGKDGAFPSPESLFNADLKELEECSLGYRAPYVRDAAKKVFTKEIDLEECEKLNDSELLEELMKIKGVGKKVANCIALFGYYRTAAFPRDVWINKIEEKYYSGRFPEEKYEGFAGILQQYMFFYERESKNAEK